MTRQLTSHTTMTCDTQRSKMEGNRDESDRCIKIAQKFIDDGERDKASKYLQKAERLYPSQRAKDLLDVLSKLNGTANTNDFSSAKQNGDVKNHKKRNVSGNADKEYASTATETKLEYTSEQLEAVKKIKKCKDYYEILGLTKDATDSDLKKQYRKMALQFHPDKNKAPGATEAFKAIGNAFGTLSDMEKRKRYDKYGADEEVRSRSAQHRTNSYEYDYTRGFEAEMTAEELFNMFFGGSTFNSANVYTRRGNRWTQQRERHQNHHGSEQREQTSYSALLQLLPILILVALSLTSTFFVSEPPYSLQKTQKFMLERSSQNLRIPYFVKETFMKEYENNIQRLEQQIEDEYVNGLRQACFREMNYKESLLWRARSFGDRELTTKANSMKMPSCESFRKLQERNYS